MNFNTLFDISKEQLNDYQAWFRSVCYLEIAQEAVDCTHAQFMTILNTHLGCNSLIDIQINLYTIEVYGLYLLLQHSDLNDLLGVEAYINSVIASGVIAESTQHIMGLYNAFCCDIKTVMNKYNHGTFTSIVADANGNNTFSSISIMNEMYITIMTDWKTSLV